MKGARSLNYEAEAGRVGAGHNVLSKKIGDLLVKRPLFDGQDRGGSPSEGCLGQHLFHIVGRPGRFVAEITEFAHLKVDNYQ